MFWRRINPEWIEGTWKAGWALDSHSKCINKSGVKRTYLGELIYQIKYQGKKRYIPKVSRIIVKFLKTRYVLPYISVILPVPPSNYDREFQPLFEIAGEVGQLLKIPVDNKYIIKVKDTPQIKNIHDKELRRNILKNAFEVSDLRYKGRKVLLLDDIFDSGATLEVITELLYNDAQVDNVYVLAITRTRKNE